jgi:surface polysaccharide O-acyltransferase-like enzyme
MGTPADNLFTSWLEFPANLLLRTIEGRSVHKIQSVDAMRVIAIVAVIVIHTMPFRTTDVPIGTVFNLSLILNQLGRFAVPFFFVLSGFFWARKIEGADSVQITSRKMVIRILVIFFAWSVFYLLPTDIVDAIASGPLGPIKVVYWHTAKALAQPVTTLLQGTKVHLWFLVALICCVTISATMVSWNMRRGLIVLSLILFGLGILGKPYADSPIGFHVDFDFRNGPFFGLIFFVTGYLLQQRGPRKSWLGYGLALAVLGSCLHLIEVQTLNSLWGTTMLQDYVVGTFFSGVGMAMIALSGSRLLCWPAFSHIAPFVLGIYAIHFAFIELMYPLDGRFMGNTLWGFAYPTLVFALSTLAVFAISRIQVMKSIVT